MNQNLDHTVGVCQKIESVDDLNLNFLINTVGDGLSDETHLWVQVKSDYMHYLLSSKLWCSSVTK